ncbi:MAG: hypothetical protein KC613_26790 [Myxococcales bacterium]|nr:hypothetical protein [Myxococcales bacterium]
MEQVEAAWTSVKALEPQLRSSSRLEGVSQALHDGLKAMERAMPCPVRVRSDPNEPSLTARMEKVSAEVVDFFALSPTAAKEGRRRGDKRKKGASYNKKAKDALQAAANKALANVAGKFGEMCPEPLVNWVADRLERDAQHSDTALITAAGRLLVLDGGGRDRLRATLVERSEALAGGAWAWTWASALLSFGHVAPSLSDADVTQLVDVLVARADALAEKGSKADETGEIALALVGLMRIRETRSAKYGPETEWSRELAAKVVAWRNLLPDEALERPPRFRLDSGRNVWVALEELIEGRRPILLNTE